MEVLCALGAAAATAIGVAVALPGGRGVAVASPGRAARSARHVVGRLLRRLGTLPAVAALMGLPAWAALVAELREAAGEHGLEADDPEVAGALVLAAAAVVAAGGVLFASVAAALVVAVALPVVVAVRHSSRVAASRREVAASMPGVFRTLSVAMGSGQTLAQAVEYVGTHERGPASRAFGRMSLRLRCGVSTERAVELLAEELDSPGASLLASALVISHRTGCPLRDLLMRSARLVERQGEFERLLSVKTAQVRLSVKVVCLLPVLLVGVLALVSPDFQEGLLTPVGLGCVAAALALDGVALLIIRRIVSGVL